METLYRIIELIDGERIPGIRIIPYAFAQRIKWALLARIR